MSDAKAIKKHAAQHDLFNRLHSIAADEKFVAKVAQTWFNGRFEVIANQRCGTWYCDPTTSSSTYAYFKSTDGHTLNWDFNLRRSNLSLATRAEEKGGFLLVDSTRRGKRMPDGLSKTVPIWCAVVNRALYIRREVDGVPHPEDWDTALYLPGQIVSPSERAQIEARLDGWAETLENSFLPLPKLEKPLRPFFVHPATSYPPEIPASPSYTPIICVSASRWVNDGERGDIIPTATQIGEGFFSRTVAFDYVPGAGDDDELWGHGLKPAVYHKHKTDLLATSRDDLPDLVDELVDVANGLTKALSDVSLDDTVDIGGLWGGSTPVAPNVTLDLGIPIRPSTAPRNNEARNTRMTIRVLEVAKPLKDTPSVLPLDASGTSLVFAVPSPRSHGKEFISALGALAAKIRPYHGDVELLLSPGSRDELDTALRLHTAGRVDSGSVEPATTRFQPGMALDAAELQAARKVIIPIAIALLSAIPTLDDGEGDAPQGVDKGVVAVYLHGLVALWPDGNAPRAALKRINEFLMSNEYH